MAEATIRLPGGGVASIKGTAEEVAKVLQLAGFGPDRRADDETPTSSRLTTPTTGRPGHARGGPRDHVLALKTSGFFRQERALADIQAELRRQAHIYALGTLSPTMVRLVRDRELGRVKGKSGRWTYVNR